MLYQDARTAVPLSKGLFGGASTVARALSSRQAKCLQGDVSVETFSFARLVTPTMAAPRKAVRHPDAEDLARRAFQAYWRFPRPGEPLVKLDDARADVVEIRNRWYVVLTAGKKRVAVFRVKADDKLRRMVRLPPELKQEE